MSVTFDECFQTFPELKVPGDMADFWKNAQAELQKVPVEPQQKMLLKKSLGWESMQDISFQSFGGARVTGVLTIPRKRGKVPAVISFHDYHADLETGREFTDSGLAHLAIRLRGHEDLTVTRTPDGEVGPPPFFQQKGIAAAEKSYPYACYLDALRAVDFLRLQRGIDHSRIGLVGRGFGAALAVFAAIHRKNVQALSLEQMGFTVLAEWMKVAEADYAEELRNLTGKNARNRIKARKNLDYFDVLNYSEDIRQPLMAFIGLNDMVNPAPPAFGFFNRVTSDKSMELFPEESDQPPPAEIRKKSVEFLGSILNAEE